MLIGNQSVLHKMVSRKISGQVSSGDRANWNLTGYMRNWGAQTGLNWKLSAVPYGYYAGGAQLLPKTVGAMVARRTITASGAGSLTLIGTVPTTCEFTGNGTSALDAIRLIQAALSATASASQSFAVLGLAGLTLEATALGEFLAELVVLVQADMQAFATGSFTANGTVVAGASMSATANGTLTAELTGQALATLTAAAQSSQDLDMLATRLMELQAQGNGALDIGIYAEALAFAAFTATAGVQATLTAKGFMTLTTETVGDGAPTAGAIAAEVWGYVSRTLTAGGGGGGGLTLEQATWLQELHQKEGLDADYPVTVDKGQNKIFIGDPLNPLFVINMSGDFRVVTTLERAP